MTLSAQLAPTRPGPWAPTGSLVSPHFSAWLSHPQIGPCRPHLVPASFSLRFCPLMATRASLGRGRPGHCPLYREEKLGSSKPGSPEAPPAAVRAVSPWHGSRAASLDLPGGLGLPALLQTFPRLTLLICEVQVIFPVTEVSELTHRSSVLARPRGTGDGRVLGRGGQLRL